MSLTMQEIDNLETLLGNGSFGPLVRLVCDAARRGAELDEEVIELRRACAIFRESTSTLRAELAAIKAAQPEYMCPNCVSPWKCNGPHIPQHTIKGGYLIEEVSSSGYATGSAGGSGAISDETVKRVLTILMHEYPGIRVAIESVIAAAQEGK